MANTYYARAVVKGSSTPQLVDVQAASAVEAKKLMASRLGPIQRFVSGPTKAVRPPNWYK